MNDKTNPSATPATGTPQATPARESHDDKSKAAQMTPPRAEPELPSAPSQTMPNQTIGASRKV